MSQLYVMQFNGEQLGPLTQDVVVSAIADGKMHRDALVAVPGSQQWVHASQLPEVAVALEALIRARSTPPNFGPEAPTVVIPPPAKLPKSEPPAAQPKAAETKPAEAPKHKWPSWLPVMIFAAFAVLGVIEVGVFALRTLQGG